MSPLISIVTGVFNSQKFLEESAQSILATDDVSIEWIAVDDGSTDNSFEILRHIAQSDSRVRVFQQPHQGLTCALIRGCKEAQGTYIARQDADDMSLAGRFRKQSQFLQENPRVSIVSCWTRLLGPEK